VKKYHIISTQENYKRLLKTDYNRRFLTYATYQENFFFLLKENQNLLNLENINLNNKSRLLNTNTTLNFSLNNKLKKEN